VVEQQLSLFMQEPAGDAELQIQCQLEFAKVAQAKIWGLRGPHIDVEEFSRSIIVG